MRKTALVLLALVMVLGLAACGESIAEQNAKIARGEINGNVYTSTYNGITFTKPDSWVYATDAEIAASVNLGAEALDQNNFEKTVSEAVSVYDMSVKDPTGGSNVMILYENLSLSNPKITESEYLATLEKQLKEQTAIAYTIGQTATKTIGGKVYKSLEMTASYSGISMAQTYYVRKIDNFMVGIIITAIGDTTVDDITAMIS